MHIKKRKHETKEVEVYVLPYVVQVLSYEVKEIDSNFPAKWMTLICKNHPTPHESEQDHTMRLSPIPSQIQCSQL